MFRMFSMYRKLRNPGEGLTDNCVVNVIPIGDELIAASEVDYVHQINPRTLDSVQRVSFCVTYCPVVCVCVYMCWCMCVA